MYDGTVYRKLKHFCMCRILKPRQLFYTFLVSFYGRTCFRGSRKLTAKKHNNLNSKKFASRGRLPSVKKKKQKQNKINKTLNGNLGLMQTCILWGWLSPELRVKDILSFSMYLAVALILSGLITFHPLSS